MPERHKKKKLKKRRKGPDQLQVTDPVSSPRAQERNTDANIWPAQGHTANSRIQSKGLHLCGPSKPPPCKLPLWPADPPNPQQSADLYPGWQRQAVSTQAGEALPQPTGVFPACLQRSHCSACRGNWRTELRAFWNWQKRTSGKGNTFQKQTYLCTSFYFL